MVNGKLTSKQQRFVEEYLIDFNGTQAAIRAGYKENSAHDIASENLRKPEIKAYIEAKKAEMAERCAVTVERVLQEYARIGFLDPRKLYDDDGALKSVHELDDDTAAAISKLSSRTTFTQDGDGETHTNITLVDKKGALDSMSRHLGIFNDSLKLEDVTPRDTFISRLTKKKVRDDD